MARVFSLEDAGGPLGAPIVSAGTSQLDAEWFVDFTSMPDQIAVDLSIVAKADAFSISPASVDLRASSVEGDVTGQVLATIALPLAGTGGVFAGASSNVTIANPGGRKYLALVSRTGTG